MKTITTEEQKKMCEALYRTINIANKTIRELGMAFALLAFKTKKYKEEHFENKK